jgi:uncharacterized membrane-anchored protein YhcB (DUF1043 family)
MIEEVVSFLLGVITGIAVEYLYLRTKNKNLLTQTRTEEKNE